MRQDREKEELLNKHADIRIEKRRNFFINTCRHEDREKKEFFINVQT